MEEKRYNFVYKTTNIINGRFYYGVHSTNNLDDGYMGSGIIISHEIKKHGKQNFKREIIKMFENIEQAYEYEKEIVTHNIINDPLCYNLTIGGRGGIVKPEKNYKKNEEYRKKISNGVKRYYESSEGGKRKKRIKEERKAFWDSEAGRLERQKISENNKLFYSSEEGKAIQQRRINSVRKNGRSKIAIEKQARSIKKFWGSIRGKQTRENYRKYHSGPNASAWDTGNRYDVLDVINNQYVLSNAAFHDIVSYFGVKIFPNSYIKKNKLYCKKYKFIIKENRK